MKCENKSLTLLLLLLLILLLLLLLLLFLLRLGIETIKLFFKVKNNNL